MARDTLRNFYSRYEIFIFPVIKFLLALITYLTINSRIGYMESLTSPVLSIMAALINAVLPPGLIIVFSALFIVLHIYRLSLVCAALTLMLFIILFLAFFRFAPKNAITVVLMPLSFVMHVPFLVPMCTGLVGNPLSSLSVSCGVVVYYFLKFIVDNESVIRNPGDATIAEQVTSIIGSIARNKNILLFIIAFSVIIILVWLIRRLPVPHNWTIAILAGGLVGLMAVLIGAIAMDLEVSVFSMIFNTILAIALGFVLQFFLFSVDFTRTEYVQFEDEEYYYYVRAVPKISVSVSERRVKRVSKASKVSRTP